MSRKRFSRIFVDRVNKLSYTGFMERYDRVKMLAFDEVEVWIHERDREFTFEARPGDLGTVVYAADGFAEVQFDRFEDPGALHWVPFADLELQD